MTPRSHKVRVLIVEDSAVAAMLLQHIIGADPRLEVAGVAASGEIALALLPTLRPDVILMDVFLPGIDGVETTRRIMRTQPTPIVVTSAALSRASLTISMDALRAGALTVIEKQLDIRRPDHPKLARQLCTQITIMSQVQVIRQREARPDTLRRTVASAAPLLSRTVPGLSIADPVAAGGYRILGLVASTGGPNALARVLSDVPTDFPLPIVLVQHIGAEFAAGFAAWLDTQVPMPVEMATHGERVRPGRVYVAPGGRHLTIKGNSMVLTDEPPVSGQRPSGTVLFQSLADHFGAAGIGVLLTGMGDDGAQGLLAMRLAGACTLAEDETTAVIYGMPAVAAEIGAVQMKLPLDAIGARILNTVRTQRPA